MKKKILAAAIIAAIIGTTCNIYAVSDISGHWAEGIINYFMDKGFISGYKDNTMRPEAYMTKAEFYSFVNRLFGFTEISSVSFKDVASDKWYYNDILKAKAADCIDDGIYAYPDEYIKREEAAEVICRAMKLSKNEEAAAAFADLGDISANERGYVGAVYANGIVKGFPDGCFYPQQRMKRAEVFAVLKAANDYSLNHVSETSKKDASNITVAEPGTQAASASEATQKNTVSSVKDSYKIPKRVSNVNDWEKAIRYATENLYDGIELEIEGFDDSVYSLENLGLTNISMAASGSIKGGVAYVNYEFNYERENYKLIRAVENTQLRSKLSTRELQALDSLKSITSGIISPSMSEYEKEKAIHDYIVSSYSYPSDSGGEFYSIMDAMDTKIAYCDAAASMFYIMSKYADLGSGLIEGKLDGQNHLWNYVVIEGKYYNLDVTADMYIAGEETYGITYKVFNVPDEWINGQYVRNPSVDLPVFKSTDANYYYKNGLVFKDANTFAAYVEKALASHPENIMIYTDGFEIDKNTFDNTRIPKYIESYKLATVLKNKQQCKILIPKYRG